MRREPVKKWDVRSFERNVDAAHYLNSLTQEGKSPAVVAACGTEAEVTLVVTYFDYE